MSLAAIALLLGVVAHTVWRARRRLANASPLRRRGVVLLNFLACLAMLLILAPPEVEWRLTEGVVVVTEGATVVPTTTRTFVLRDAQVTGAENLPRLRSMGQLALEVPGLRELTVLGHGLEALDWSQLPEGLAVDWSPPPLTAPVGLFWPQWLLPGETLVVSGELRNDRSNSPLQLQLLDPAGVIVDRTTLAPEDHFALRATPRASGPVVYRLQLLDGERILADEPVATFVREAAPAQLLILQSAPSFETRQLANWASDRGARLVASSQVSRDRDLLQRVNLPADYSTALAPELLDGTDLAVIDGRRWRQLADTDRKALLAAVRGGLGLMLMLDEDLAAVLENPAQQQLLGLRLRPDADDDLRRLRGEAGVGIPGLPVAPWAIELAGAHALNVDERGSVLEAWRALGRGRIALSRLRERHRWATSGNTSLFNRYWAGLLQQLGRARAVPRWSTPPSPATLRPGERSRVCARDESRQRLHLSLTPMTSTSGAPAVAQAHGLRVHPSGEPLQCGYIWPATEGWHALRLRDERGAIADERMLRVAAEGEWRGERFARRQKATGERVLATAGSSALPPVTMALQPGWGWLLLLLCLVPLWVERRLFALD